MRLAVIDIGTNTFNLLIVDATTKPHKVLHDSKMAVMLGEGGITDNVIKPAAFKRGINTLKVFAVELKKWEVKSYSAIATSAIRSATNGAEFCSTSLREAGIEILTITGEREAELIYNGVKAAMNIGLEPVLILDIGGGSNEFIIANQNEIFWKRSFNMGIARLLEKFSPGNPITENQIKQVEKYFTLELQPLFDELKNYTIQTLVGSSGSFDTFADMVSHRFYGYDVLKNKTEFTFDLKHYGQVHQFLVVSTKEQRAADKGIIAMRLEMIVLASMLVNFIVKNASITKLRMSTYALKEGALQGLISKG
jgi:exopolyphosphatase/guanosine-5'-triphosphate,3'-diphosphate pyrophosphatase